MATSNLRRRLDDYTQMRTLPGLLSVAFFASTLYMFGAVSSIELVWLNYTLGAEHAMLVSLGTYAVAFASSETKQFEHYEGAEQALVAAGPAIIVAYEYFPAFVDFLNSIGDPLGHQLAAVVCIVAWGVTVQ